MELQKPLHQARGLPKIPRHRYRYTDIDMDKDIDSTTKGQCKDSWYDDSWRDNSDNDVLAEATCNPFPEGALYIGCNICQGADPTADCKCVR